MYDIATDRKDLLGTPDDQLTLGRHDAIKLFAKRDPSNSVRH